MIFRVLASNTQWINQWEVVLSGSLDEPILETIPPTEELDLEVPVVDKQYLKFEVLSWYKEGGGLDYFDIVRTVTEPQVKTELKRDCSKRSGQCPALPQFCPHADCVPTSLRWADITSRGQVQQGCTFTKDGLSYFNQSFCLSKVFGLGSYSVDDEVVLLNTNVTTMFSTLGLQFPVFLPCQPWNDSEPCSNKKPTVTNKLEPSDGNTFSFRMNIKSCRKTGVKIELVDISDGLNKTGLKLFSWPVPNYPVELQIIGECFQVKKNLCGPDSLSFFSNQGDLVLTNCAGVLTMRKEYDYCG